MRKGKANAGEADGSGLRRVEMPHPRVYLLSLLLLQLLRLLPLFDEATNPLLFTVHTSFLFLLSIAYLSLGMILAQRL